MSGVRNGVLGRGVSSSAAYLPLITVPAYETVLLKSVFVWNSAATSTPVSIELRSADGLVKAYAAQWELASNEVQHWDGWVALNPNDELLLYSAIEGVHVWCSGAALPGALSSVPL